MSGWRMATRSIIFHSNLLSTKFPSQRTSNTENVPYDDVIIGRNVSGYVKVPRWFSRRGTYFMYVHIDIDTHQTLTQFVVAGAPKTNILPRVTSFRIIVFWQRSLHGEI